MWMVQPRINGHDFGQWILFQATRDTFLPTSFPSVNNPFVERDYVCEPQMEDSSSFV